MKVGLFLPNFARWFRGDEMALVCERAKAMGVGSLWFGDHVITTAAQRVGYGNGYMDIWAATAYLAAVTNMQGWSPLLCQSVVVIPHRPPIQQAKLIATIDSLAKGRLVVGAGSGYNYDEFAALGLPYDDRGGLTDEYLKCMIELWTQPVASFHGKYVNFDNMTISVRPAQQPHPPIWYGGRGPRPFRRIAEYCQGYVPGAGIVRRQGRTMGVNGRAAFPWDEEELSGPERLEKDLAELMRYWERNGRKGRPTVGISPMFCQVTDKREEAGQMVERGTSAAGELTYVSHYPIIHVDDLVQLLRDYADVGVDHIGVGPGSYRYQNYDNQGNLLHQLDLLAEHVLPRLPADNRPVAATSYVGQ